MAVTFRPLGDQAVLIDAPSERAALALAQAARRLPWAVDVVSAYASVAVFYDLRDRDYERARADLERLAGQDLEVALPPPRRHVVPCCYELGLDADLIARHTGQPTERVIALHTETIYTVYAIGFCPGFPYLGYLPEALAGVPRLPSPRLRVEVGSVALTGRQTGIYTEPRPGGWNILGRTPLELVNVRDGYFPLRTGDEVRFVRIDDKEFARLLGERLI